VRVTGWSSGRAGRGGALWPGYAALASPALALSLLAAGCGGAAASHPAALSRVAAHATTPAHAPPSRAAQPEASPAGDQAGSLLPLSATFISPAVGWLLADQCGPGPQPQSCSAVMRKTTDGGRQWFPVPAPSATPVTYPDYEPHAGVAQVRFADPANGWVFGPDLWVTHDGGATWRQLSTGGLMVTSLEAADGHAVAVFAGNTTFQVYTSAVGSDAWQAVPGADGPAQGAVSEVDRNPQVAIEGSTAYVSSSGIYAESGGGVLLTGPADGSAPWQRLPVPCPPYASAQMPVATVPGELVLGCGGDAASGQSQKYVFTSADGGGSWQTRAATPLPFSELPQPGFLGDIAVTPAGTIVGSGDREVYFSWDNGATWHTPAALAAAVYLGGDADQVVVGMTTSEQGFALPGTVEMSLANGASWIWMTYDAGSTWIRVPIS
jgi:photosystem II stability/assembly factor-like uncharacterized protein